MVVLPSRRGAVHAMAGEFVDDVMIKNQNAHVPTITPAEGVHLLHAAYANAL